jgi:hypothetical protein
VHLWTWLKLEVLRSYIDMITKHNINRPTFKSKTNIYRPDLSEFKILTTKCCIPILRQRTSIKQSTINKDVKLDHTSTNSSRKALPYIHYSNATSPHTHTIFQPNPLYNTSCFIQQPLPISLPLQTPSHIPQAYHTIQESTAYITKGKNMRRVNELAINSIE